MWTTALRRRALSLGSMAARSSSTTGKPLQISAVVYSYVDGMMEKRQPHRSNHLQLLTNMSDDGTCLLGGAFAEPCDGAVLLFSSPEKAKEFVENDPYKAAGLVTKYQIRDYMAVVGSFLQN